MSLIAVDAGHGGYDNGASFNGRLEKNDNLRLAQAVRDELEAMGEQVIMTRDSDVFVPLNQRAAIANNAGADLFISLHRNSYPEETPSTKGVDNYIHTYAPAETERMARIVLDHVVNVGVQADRGVQRANFAVLRNTNMPAMLLEMGFIMNPEDNRLFDEKLHEYARAIAEGAIEALGDEKNEAIRAIQQMLNDWYGAGLQTDGIYGPATKKALVRAVQMVLNRYFGASLKVDGVFGPATRGAIPTLRMGSRGPLVYLLQSALALNGYNPGKIDGIFGSKTRNAVRNFQQANGLTVDGMAGPNTFEALLR